MRRSDMKSSGFSIKSWLLSTLCLFLLIVSSIVSSSAHADEKADVCRRILGTDMAHELTKKSDALEDHANKFRNPFTGLTFESDDIGQVHKNLTKAVKFYRWIYTDKYNKEILPANKLARMQTVVEKLIERALQSGDPNTVHASLALSRWLQQRWSERVMEDRRLEDEAKQKEEQQKKQPGQPPDQKKNQPGQPKPQPPKPNQPKQKQPGEKQKEKDKQKQEEQDGEPSEDQDGDGDGEPPNPWDKKQQDKYTPHNKEVPPQNGKGKQRVIFSTNGIPPAKFRKPGYFRKDLYEVIEGRDWQKDLASRVVPKQAPGAGTHDSVIKTLGSSSLIIPKQYGFRPIETSTATHEVIEKEPGVFELRSKSGPLPAEVKIDLQVEAPIPSSEHAKIIRQNTKKSGINPKLWPDHLLAGVEEAKARGGSVLDIAAVLEEYMAHRGPYFYHSKDGKDLTLEQYAAAQQILAQLERQMPRPVAMASARIFNCDGATDIAVIILRDLLNIPARAAVGPTAKGTVQNKTRLALTDDPIEHAWVEVFHQGEWYPFDFQPKKNEPKPDKKKKDDKKDEKKDDSEQLDKPDESKDNDSKDGDDSQDGSDSQDGDSKGQPGKKSKKSEGKPSDSESQESQSEDGQDKQKSKGSKKQSGGGSGGEESDISDITQKAKKEKREKPSGQPGEKKSDSKDQEGDDAKSDQGENAKKDGKKSEKKEASEQSSNDAGDGASEDPNSLTKKQIEEALKSRTPESAKPEQQGKGRQRLEEDKQNDADHPPPDTVNLIVKEEIQRFSSRELLTNSAKDPVMEKIVGIIDRISRGNLRHALRGMQKDIPAENADILSLGDRSLADVLSSMRSDLLQGKLADGYHSCLQIHRIFQRLQTQRSLNSSERDLAAGVAQIMNLLRQIRHPSSQQHELVSRLFNNLPGPITRSILKKLYGDEILTLGSQAQAAMANHIASGELARYMRIAALKKFVQMIMVAEREPRYMKEKVLYRSVEPLPDPDVVIAKSALEFDRMIFDPVPGEHIFGRLFRGEQFAIGPREEVDVPNPRNPIERKKTYVFIDISGSMSMGDKNVIASDLMSGFTDFAFADRDAFGNPLHEIVFLPYNTRVIGDLATKVKAVAEAEKFVESHSGATQARDGTSINPTFDYFYQDIKRTFKAPRPGERQLRRANMVLFSDGQDPTFQLQPVLDGLKSLPPEVRTTFHFIALGETNPQLQSLSETLVAHANARNYHYVPYELISEIIQASRNPKFDPDAFATTERRASPDILRTADALLKEATEIDFIPEDRDLLDLTSKIRSVQMDLRTDTNRVRIYEFVQVCDTLVSSTDVPAPLRRRILWRMLRDYPQLVKRELSRMSDLEVQSFEKLRSWAMGGGN